MKRIINIAVVLLVLQISLAIALYLDRGKTDAQSIDTPLFSFSPETVTVVEITGPEKEYLILEKSGDSWSLPGAFAAPANSQQIEALLARLASLKQGFAVATSTAAAKRFKVADDLFQRRVVLKAGEKVVADLYVGTSPGFRQIHARKQGSEDVVAVELSTFELETATDQWLDKNIFQFKEEEIEAISFADFTLKKDDKTWQVTDLQEGQTTDAKTAGELVAKIAGLTVQSVVGPQEAEGLFSGAPALQYTVTRKGGGPAEFRFVKAEGDSYYLKQSERALYCKVHTLQVEGLLKVKRETLLAGSGSAESAKADGAGAETPVEKSE